MVVIGLESVEVGEFGALNFEQFHVREDHRRNELLFIRIVKPGVRFELMAASNIQAFGTRMMALMELIVL